MSEKGLMLNDKCALCFCIEKDTLYYDVLATKEMLKAFWQKDEKTIRHECLKLIEENEIEEIEDFSKDYYNENNTVTILQGKTIYPVNKYLYSLFSEMSNFVVF